MKRLLIKSLFAGCLALFALVGFQSCNDDWDEHYDSKTEGDVYDGSLMALIDSEPELSDFAEILRATGFDQQLEKNQMLTVLAPKNNSFDKSELLEMINNGQKDRVITEFLKNHISRYNQSMDLDKHSIMMLNDKILNMETKKVATIEDVNVSEMNKACKNGILHILDEAIPYAFNIYELLSVDFEQQKENTGEYSSEWETMCEYIYKMQTQTLDETHSISHGIDQETGEKIWVDSVVIENNQILRPLDAYLYREDSTYLAIFPSLEAYNRRVEGIKSLFNYSIAYNPEEEYRDSMQRYYAHYYTMCDLIYNLNRNNMRNPLSKLDDITGQPVDTLFSTAYSRNLWPYHVYHDVFGENGILSSYNDVVECSNGYVYKMDNIPFTVFDNVFKKITVEAENRQYIYDTEPNFTVTTTTIITPVSAAADSITGWGYMHIVPTSSRNTELTYSIPSTLSGQYDIYVKFLPLNVYDPDATLMPLQFRASIYERNATNGTFPTEAKPTFEFKNPEDGKANFHTNAEKTDSVYIGTYKFNNCYRGADAGVLLKLESYVLTSQAKTYTKEMLIDKIVFVPNRELHDADGVYGERNLDEQR